MVVKIGLQSKFVGQICYKARWVQSNSYGQRTKKGRDKVYYCRTHGSSKQGKKKVVYYSWCPCQRSV